MLSFLANHPIICPNLKTVEIRIRVVDPDEVSQTTIGVFSQAISLHNHLESLSTSVPINDVALMHLAMSSKLKKLTLTRPPPGNSYSHQACFPLDTTPFRNVEELCLYGWDLCFMTTLLRTEEQTFRFFTLSYNSRPTTDELSAFLAAFASPQRAHSLQSITIQPCDDYDSDESPILDTSMHAYISYDTLRPLIYLSCLRRLAIDIGHWISMDDDEIISLARNWILLEDLELGWSQNDYGCPWRSVKYVTFKGLLSLLECCPRLRDVSLPVDAREVRIGTTTGIMCSRSLRNLSFVDSPIADPLLVAETLARHFPSAFISARFNFSGGCFAEISQYELTWDQAETHFYRRKSGFRS